MRRYKAEGKTYRESERLILKRSGRKESPAESMVRMALKRLQKELNNSKKVISDPKKTDKLGLAITMLLLKLPTSASTPPDLEAIRAKAVDLGNLLLPPE